MCLFVLWVSKEKKTHLLWVEDSDDLCDSSLVEWWDNVTARGEELQLECLKNRQQTGHRMNI